MSFIKVKRFYFNVLPTLFILLGIFFVVAGFGPLIYDEAWFKIKELKNQQLILNAKDAQEDSPFARFLTNRAISLVPVNTDFALIIERIGVNVPVVADVTVTNKDAYMAALKDGVAHASVSSYPSKEPGNVYIFAHSTVNFWELGRYAKAFNLLRKLNVGDRIHVIYQGTTYVYDVVNKEKYEGWDTYPITRSVIEPILTLQTCDPPGTTLNRLVVTAKLVNSY
ncbi:MAG: class E sortase [Patescibacteria group bacterium]|jgi:sortase A